MKLFSLLILSSVVSLAGDFMTGQAARVTIGQNTFTSQDQGPTSSQFGAVSGVAFANGQLFVVDSNRIQATPVQNRVLIYNNPPIPNPTDDIQQGIRCPVCLGVEKSAANVVLGQGDFMSSDFATPPTQGSMRTPTGIATDGQILAVADTDNNRVLIWKSIPTSVGAPATLVLGQPDFNTGKAGLDAKSMRGPQGVWIQGTRLFVADTQNHRVLIWNSIPTSNGQAADLVLGEPNFTTAPPPTTLVSTPAANNLFSPVSVTSDGQRLFVTDLGHNRVLIWNSIPTQTQQAADMVIGQPDMTSDTDNNSSAICASNGTDSTTMKPTYPARCAATLSLPRFALSDGKRLFIADGGNDRILIFNAIPTQAGQPADVILGQPDEFSDVVTDSTDTFRPDSNILRSSASTIRTPLGLAWDGTNLFVSDPFDRRVLVFTPGVTAIPLNGITNSASRTVFAIGSLTFSGTITKNDSVTLKINDTSYTYTIQDKDTIQIVIQALADMINGKNGGTPDANVSATANPAFNELLLTSKLPGTDGNNITYSVTTAGATSTASATITVTTAGANLNGGQNAAEVPPGTLVTINGTNLADTPPEGVKGVPDSNDFYPTTLAGVQVYFDGIKAPLLLVSPTQINTQIPFEVADASSISAYVRTVHKDGTVTTTAAIAVPVVDQNPGIFAFEGSDPRPVIATHFSSNGIAVVSVDGQIKDQDTATVTIEDRSYTYTVQAPSGGANNDTLTTVRDKLVALINANPDEKVIASPSGQYTRIILTAKVPGPDGNGIAIGGSSGSNASIIITALNGSTCCASAAGSPVTENNPATPGEVIAIFATGLGITIDSALERLGITGQLFHGPIPNSANIPVDNAQVGGRTANVLNSGLVLGMLGVYEVDLQLNTSLPTNPRTQMYIAQSVFTSNIVTIPIVAPIPPQ